MEFGIIGLGKMEGNIALQCTEKGIKVVEKARGPKPELTEKGEKSWKSTEVRKFLEKAEGDFRFPVFRDQPLTKYSKSLYLTWKRET